MRGLLVLSCALVLLAPVADAASGTSLTVAYVADADRPTERVRWTLRCDPLGGTHPRRAAVCRELARLGREVFRRIPPDVACAQVYGGPRVAIVSGHMRGRRVWARLTRVDGCQIARWERVPGLLPKGGVP